VTTKKKPEPPRPEPTPYVAWVCLQVAKDDLKRVTDKHHVFIPPHPHKEDTFITSEFFYAEQERRQEPILARIAYYEALAKK